MTGESRLAGALAVLREAGFPEAGVAVAGHDRTIAVITGLAPTSATSLARLAPQLKALGFRYITLDITEPQP